VIQTCGVMADVAGLAYCAGDRVTTAPELLIVADSEASSGKVAAVGVRQGRQGVCGAFSWQR